MEFKPGIPQKIQATAAKTKKEVDLIKTEADNALEKEKRSRKFWEILEKTGILVQKDPLILDFERIQEIVGKIEFKRNKNISLFPSDVRSHQKSEFLYIDFLNELKDIRCFSKNEFTTEKFTKGEIKPHFVFNLPSSAGNLVAGDFDEPGLDVENFLQNNAFLTKKLVLKDGTETCFAEILISKIMKNLSPHRDENGQLKIIDPRDNKEKDFSAKMLMDEIIYRQIFIELEKEERKIAYFGGILFAKEFLKNLYGKVFQENDFKVSGKTSANEIFSIHKRKLNPKAPFVSFTNDNGAARYYIGRKKIIGTDIDINQNMYAVQLDTNLIGIIEEIPGRKSRLICTFNGLNKEEYDKKRDQLIESFTKRGKIATKQDITNGITTNAQEATENIKEYKITGLFPKKNKESPEDYAERLAQLSDVNYVINNFREFFREANIGVHNLSWSDQLIIANNTLGQKDNEALLNFASKFKLKGLRTFLSIEQNGPEMGNKILELAEKLPEDVVKIIFAKFSEIIDSVNDVINTIQERFDKKTDDPSVLNSIKETLLKKGSDLLVEYSKLASKCNTKEECAKLEPIIFQKLANIKHNAILLGSAFKSVLKEGMNLNQIKDVALEATNQKETLLKYKDEMIKIFSENRINYPKELLKETLDEFKEAIDNPNNKEFYILKDKEDIIAFMRFDKLPNGNLYAGSLNSLNEIHGLAIGGALLKELLVEKSQNHTVEAIVYDKNPMLHRYIEDYGFKIVGEIENYHGTGQKFFKIEIAKGSIKNQEPTSSASALSQSA